MRRDDRWRPATVSLSEAARSRLRRSGEVEVRSGMTFRPDCLYPGRLASPERPRRKCAPSCKHRRYIRLRRKLGVQASRKAAVNKRTGAAEHRVRLDGSADGAPNVLLRAVRKPLLCAGACPLITRLIVHLFRSHRGAFALRRPIRKSAPVRGRRTAPRTHFRFVVSRTAEASNHTSRTANGLPLPCIDIQLPPGGSPR